MKSVLFRIHVVYRKGAFAYAYVGRSYHNGLNFIYSYVSEDKAKVDRAISELKKRTGYTEKNYDNQFDSKLSNYEISFYKSW